MCPANNSWLADVAEKGDKISAWGHAVAVGAGGLAVVAAPTGLVGAVLGGVAFGARTASLVATGASILLRSLEGNHRGATSTATGLLVGAGAGKAALGLVKFNGRFTGRTAGRADKVAASAVDTSASKIASAAVCGE